MTVHIKTDHRVSELLSVELLDNISELQRHDNEMACRQLKYPLCHCLIKEMIQCATIGIPKGMKNAISISIAFALIILIRNENITFEECKTKNRLK